MDDRPVPAVLRSFKATDENGVELTRTIRLISGRIRVSPGAGSVRGAYEQQFTMERWEDGYVMQNGSPVFTGIQVLKETRVFADHGTVGPLYEGSGTLVFLSEVLPGFQFTGGRAEDGAYATTQRIYDSGDQVRLRFAL